MSDAPIGIFDSGSGGLSILNAIESLLPHESFVYFGDHLHSPYGDKSTPYIRERVVTAIRFLLSKKVKLIVIACNTATIAGIDYFREQFPDIPIVGVVPVIKTAVRMSQKKNFIVLSTNYTAKSDYQKKLIHVFAGDCTVHSLGSSTLVPLIEEGKIDGPEIREELTHIFKRMNPSQVDVIVLGCTHYPFLVPAIRAIIGSDIHIIDSSAAVARQVKRILEEREESSEGKSKAPSFFTTGDHDVITTLFNRLLSREVVVSHVNI